MKKPKRASVLTTFYMVILWYPKGGQFFERQQVWQGVYSGHMARVGLQLLNLTSSGCFSGLTMTIISQTPTKLLSLFQFYRKIDLSNLLFLWSSKIYRICIWLTWYARTEIQNHGKIRRMNQLLGIFFCANIA